MQSKNYEKPTFVGLNETELLESNGGVGFPVVVGAAVAVLVAAVVYTVAGGATITVAGAAFTVAAAQTYTTVTKPKQGEEGSIATVNASLF